MSDPPLRVLIAGGGIAGLELLTALHHLAPDEVDLTLAEVSLPGEWHSEPIGS